MTEKLESRKGFCEENRAEWFVQMGHALEGREGETLATEGLVSGFGIYITTGKRFLLAHVFIEQLEWFLPKYENMIRNAVRIVVASSNPDHENYKNKLPAIQKLKNVEYVRAGSMVADLNNVITTEILSGIIRAKKSSDCELPMPDGGGPGPQGLPKLKNLTYLEKSTREEGLPKRELFSSPRREPPNLTLEEKFKCVENFRLFEKEKTKTNPQKAFVKAAFHRQKFPGKWGK